MGTQIREIVRLLNDPPFSKNFSLVAFDEQQPHELMLLINEVLGTIDERQKVDMHREDPVMAQNRILLFLHGLAYRPDDPDNFAMKLFNGDRDVCYQLLEWLLASKAAHQKRAYLAPFLTEIDVPQELFHDEMVKEIRESCLNLKEEFIHSHKQLAVLEEATQDPEAKKDMIRDLDDERRQLTERVSRLEKKLQGSLPDYEEMALACQRLKREQEDEKALKKRYKDQVELLSQAKRGSASAKERLEKIRNEQGRLLDGDAETMLSKLIQDVATKKKQAHEVDPRRVADLRSKLDDIKQVMQGSSYSQQDIEQLQNTQRRLDQDTDRMQRELDAPAAADDKITMFRQQASMIARKKEAMQAQLDEQRALKASMEKQLEEKELSFDSMGTGGHMKPDAFRQMKQDVRAKSTLHKKMKAEFDELRAERGVLQRTVDILKLQCKDHEGWLREQERAAGVEGATENLERLEQVSSQKAVYDQKKGLTIEQHAMEVEKVRLTIKEKKQKLAPMIKDLRAERGKFQMLDAEYTTKKEAYESRKLKYESDFLGLTTAR
jgi:intraflagellar transport protein 81